MELKFVVFTIMVCVSMGTTSPSPSEVARVEKTLLSMLGMSERPVVDRKKAQIPQEMIDLYHEQIGQDYASSALPLPGRLTRSANTVRSYTHQGKTI